jgi:hypothetical protein
MDQDARLVRLEDALSRLAEAQARTEAAVSRLAEAQARMEARVERLETRMEQVEAALVRLAEAQARTEARVERLEARMEQVEMRMEQVEMRMEQVETRMEQVEAALVRLAEAQARTEEQLVRHGVQIEHLTEQVQALVSWQRGEAGRREGERYERDVVRRALVLFNGGQGGAPDQPEVQRRVRVWLQSLLTEDLLAADADPTLADLLWWKGDRVAVVEIAVQVNGEDVRRAVQRAKTLQQGGAQAMAMVIGEHWATPDTRERARTLGIDWKVSSDLSEGFLGFRRLTAERGNGTE